MNSLRRYANADGNFTEKINEQNIHERMFFLSPPDHGDITDFEYPVTISSSGNGVWGEGACFRLQRCGRFAVELVTSGSMRFVQDGKEYDVKPGMVYILRPGSLSEYATGGEGYAHKRFLVLEGRDLDIMRERFGLTDIDVCVLDNQRKISGLMKEATRILRDKPDEYQHSLSVLAFEIMLTLSIAVVGRRFPPSINAVLHFMNRNIERTVTVEELCGVAGISRTHFHRIFNESLGENPHRYFTKMKIRHIAAQLRSSPQRSIGDISRQNGFEDQAYFSNLFRKVMGVSPGKYRRGE